MNFPALVCFRRFSQNKRRGFTLIEIAIAMVVIGVLLGAVVPTMRALEERRQFKNENSRMETIRDAIIGYAIRNRTRARTIEFVPLYRPDFAPDFTLPSRTFHLPAGRPYLPCPDWDGDGYEDRFPSNTSRRELKSAPTWPSPSQFPCEAHTLVEKLSEHYWFGPLPSANRMAIALWRAGRCLGALWGFIPPTTGGIGTPTTPTKFFPTPFSALTAKPSRTFLTPEFRKAPAIFGRRAISWTAGRKSAHPPLSGGDMQRHFRGKLLAA